jgi:hypothetical protein
MSYVCGKCGKCCATSRAVRTPGMRCVTVNNLAKLFSQQIQLHGGDDCVTSMDGVCDADGVLAAALPSPYLNCPRVSLNFIKLYQEPAKRWLVLVPRGRIRRSDVLTTRGQRRRGHY